MNVFKNLVSNGRFSYNVGNSIINLVNLSVNKTKQEQELKEVIKILSNELKIIEADKRIKLKKSVKKSVTKKTNKKPKITPSQAFMKKLQPSKELAVITGSKQQPRTQAVSSVWSYIKKHNLQDSKNKKNIICDDKLLAVTNKKVVSMFELATFIGKHLTLVDSGK